MLPTATPLSDVRAAATLAGADSFEVSEDGSAQACFRNGWGAARYLLELSRKDARREWVQDFAKWLRKKSAGDDESFARALHEYGKGLPFIREDGEIFQGPALTAQRGGDCDCHARLMYAVAKAGGLPTELAFMHKGENPTHVYARVFVGGRWRPMETTIAADFGEDPFAAAQRLGVVRDDLMPETITMGEADNGDCPETMGALASPTVRETSQVDSGFFDALVRDAAADGGTPEMRAAVLYSESDLIPSIKNSIGCVGLNQFCPGTLSLFFSGTPDEYRSLSASQQMPFIRKFWQSKAQNFGKSVYAGNGRNLYWSNFLPDSYNGAVDDSWLIAAGPRTGNDKDASTWNGGSDFYVRANGERRPFSSLLKQNPSFVTNEGSQRVIRAGALGRALTNKIKANPKTWAEIQARIDFARGGGGPARSVASIAAFLVGAAGLGVLANYLATPAKTRRVSTPRRRARA